VLADPRAGQHITTEGHTMTTTEDHSTYFAEPVMSTSSDGVKIENGRYRLPTNDGMDGKSHLHTRVTTVSGRLPGSHGLGIWAADHIAWAMAQRPDLCAMLQSVPLTDVETIRTVRAKAEIVAAMDEGANYGTATHNILQRVDAGEPIESLARIFHPDIKGYQATLAEYGLTVLPEYIERVVRMRDYEIAGRLDNIMAEADGTLVIVDKKTKGDIDSTHDVATQLAIYAGADEMYDPVTGRYIPMPPVRRDYAIMLHIEPGSGVCTPKKIDIRLGLWSVELSMNVDRWRKMTHLSSPYVMPSPVKPADAALDVRTFQETQHAPITATVHQPPAHPYRNGHPTPQAVADTANAVLDEIHARRGSAEQHGVVIPAAVPAATAPAAAPVVSTPSPVSAPDPASYGAPAGVEPPAAYVPQTLPPRAEVVLMTTGEDGVDAEAAEIADAFANKSKEVMKLYAGRYGITDLKHHKAHIAKSIAIVRADRRKAGLPAEPEVDEQPAAATVQTGRHPQTMAEAGFTKPAPDSPPGRAVVGPDAQPQPAVQRPVDTAEQAVLADIAAATTVPRISEIWSLWTNSGREWTGNVRAAADAKVAAITSPAGPAAGSVEPPF
jgi:hypothetical protein